MVVTTLQMLMTLVTIGQKDAAEASLQALQTRAAASHISLVDSPADTLKFVEAPVFRYSDQLRHIEDAGIWIWTSKGRPVSALKIERYEPDVLPKRWVYCISSLSTDLVTAEWDDFPAFQAKQPGIVWQTLPDKPATTRAARLIQMREIARRFSADLVGQTNTLLSERHPMRLIPRPLYRYEDAGDAADGALFAFTGTGTNPDMLLLLDRPAEGEWQFGLACMTADGLTVRLGDKVVWDRPHTAGKGRVFDNWAYYIND